jgi:hypothetical protein
LRIGIVEICEANHYTAVEALALTYAINKENNITIFTLDQFKASYKFENKQIELICNKSDDISLFLNQINNQGFDKIHINTISKDFEKFAATDWKPEIILTIHNTNIWFDNALEKRRSLLIEKLKNINILKLKNTLYLPIKYFIRDFNKQKNIDNLVNQINLKDGQYLVYALAQKKYILNKLPQAKVIVFPFCIHQNLEDLSTTNQLLRVCIPGSVDQSRRDYQNLLLTLKMYQPFFNKHVSIDFLGYLSKDNQDILAQILDLKETGLSVFFNQNFIDDSEFNTRLQSCDIILGNLKVKINSQSKYGETKETGVIFNMIKAAKPGIFPKVYKPIKELEHSCIFYDDDLFEVLQNLVLNRDDLINLKKNISQAVKAFEPENLYKQLVN